MTQSTPHTADPIRRSLRGARAFSVAAVIALSAGCSAQPAPEPAPPAPVASTAPTPAPPAATVEPRATGHAPVSVDIPSIGVSGSLIDLGIDASGAMEVPADYDDIGWFTGGGRPGAMGPTVIAGHVDSLDGPAAFFSLSELQPGEIVTVTDAEGTVHSYEIYLAEEYTKADYPTARVFGATLADEIRLITCSGFFDRDIGDYDSNLVVYGRAL